MNDKHDAKGRSGSGGEGGLVPWAEEIRRRYLRGEASMFVVHGNVHDVILHDGKLLTLTEFLSQGLLANKDSVLTYNVSTGTRFAKKRVDLKGIEELLIAREPSKVLPLVERALAVNDRVGVILEHADTIAPSAETSFSTLDDRAAVVTLHRWSHLRTIEQGDSIVILLVENLSELNPKLVSNPRVATVNLPVPDNAERARTIRHVDPSLSAEDVARLTEITAGLKSIQIASILTPAGPVDDEADRLRFLNELLAEQAAAAGAVAPSALTERAEKLAKLTNGMTREEIRKLIFPEGKTPSFGKDARAEVDALIAARKREIIERECFGLIEFVDPQHGFELVGGLEEVKAELSLIAENMRSGRRKRCPMGMLFTGPMGTGKTFVAEAFAKESKLTTIKLKNFRSKWVGATEGNLERILHVIKAIGQVLVIIDEGDRAFGGGGGDGDGDGGTSSRVIARIKEFMSDTENRGRVLFILMTNRPDKLDVDLKRAGRLDRKIPFLYVQDTVEVERILRAQFRKAHVTYEGDAIDTGILSAMIGYSNADLEAVVLLAADAASARSHDAPITPEDLERAVKDYLPSRDVKMIEYMELLAVFEASNRRMLPKKYADVPVEELQARLDRLRIDCGGRR